MSVLDLSFDDVLTTTRSVRRRLDLDRPVDPDVIRECLEIAIHAPSPGSQQHWHFIVVSDPAQREALAAVYRKGAESTGQEATLRQLVESASDDETRIKMEKMAESARFLTNNLHRVPVLLVPAVEGRPENRPVIDQAALIWGSILPATWSFMLAARSRGLGTTLTSLHLEHEREAAEVLGIPYEQVTQAGLIPVAYTKGTSFKRAPRKPVDSVIHWNAW